MAIFETSPSKYELDLGDVENILNNYTAVTPPGINDDDSAGYQVGSRWINNATGEDYVLVDDTTGAAVWENTTTADIAHFRYLVRFTSGVKVPVGGTLYLSLGEGVLSSSTGELLPAAGTLIGITASLDAAVAAGNTFVVEVLSDPAGTPAVLGSALTLPPTVTFASRRDLSAAIAANTIFGARIRRTAGAGASAFGKIVVAVEVSIP